MSEPISFLATVVDAGGGEVRLLVDRDTMEYPPVGKRVEVVFNHHHTAYLRGVLLDAQDRIEAALSTVTPNHEE